MNVDVFAGIHGLRFAKGVSTSTPTASSRGRLRASSSRRAQGLRYATTSSTSVFSEGPPDLYHGPVPTSPPSSAPRLQVDDDRSRVRFDVLRQRIENIIQYRFNDPDYLRLAIFPGSARIDNQLLPKSQRQLAQVGDAAHRLLYFADQFPWKTDINIKFNTLASNVHFAKIAKRRGLDNVMRLTMGTDEQDSMPNVDATLIEAIIGAVYLDCGRNDGITRMAIDALGLGERTTFGLTAQENTSKPEISIERETSNVACGATRTDESSDTPSTAVPMPPNQSTHKLLEADQQQDDPRESDKSSAPTRGCLPISHTQSIPNKIRRLRRHSKRQGARKSALRKFLPAGPRLTTLVQLVKAISVRLETSLLGDDIRNHLDEIMHVVHDIRRSDIGGEDVAALRDQIRRLQNTSGAASMAVGTDTGNDDEVPMVSHISANAEPVASSVMPRAGDSMDQAAVPAFPTVSSSRDATNADMASTSSNSTDTKGSCAMATASDPHPAEEPDLGAVYSVPEDSFNSAEIATGQAPSLRVLDEPPPATFHQTRQRVESIIQYRFKDPDYLRAALAIDPAYIGDTQLLKPREGIAIIGDAIHKVVFFLYCFPTAYSTSRSSLPFS